MQLNEWREKDDAEQRFLIHGQLVVMNDWLRQVCLATTATRRLAEEAARRAGTAVADAPEPQGGPEAR